MDTTASSFHKGCYSERKNTGVNIREDFMLTLYQKTLSCMIESLIACTEKKSKNIPGSVLQYSTHTVFSLTYRILLTVNTEQNKSTRKLKAGISGQRSIWLYRRLQWFLPTKLLPKPTP